MDNRVRRWRLTRVVAILASLLAMSATALPASDDDPLDKEAASADTSEEVDKLDANTTALHMTGSPSNEALAAAVKRFPAFKLLRINELQGSKITDDGTTPIGTLAELEVLELGCSGLSDKAFTVIPRLKRLRSVEISGSRDGTAIGKDAMAQLAKLPALARVKLLLLTNLADDGVAELAGCPQLSDVSIVNCAGVGNACLLKLAGLPKLRALEVATDDTVTDAGLQHLARASGLSHLSLSSDKSVTDAGMEHIAKLGTLKSLNLAFSGVTDAGLTKLVGLTGLESLDLTDCNVTDAGLAHLAKLVGLRRLELGYAQVSGKGLAELAALPRLELLALNNAKGLTDKDIEALAKLKALRRHLPAPRRRYLADRWTTMTSCDGPAPWTTRGSPSARATTC